MAASAAGIVIARERPPWTDEGIPVRRHVVERRVTVDQAGSLKRRDAMLDPGLDLRDEVLIGGQLVVVGVDIFIVLGKAAPEDVATLAERANIGCIDTVRDRRLGQRTPTARLPHRVLLAHGAERQLDSRARRKRPGPGSCGVDHGACGQGAFVRQHPRHPFTLPQERPNRRACPDFAPFAGEGRDVCLGCPDRIRKAARGLVDHGRDAFCVQPGHPGLAFRRIKESRLDTDLALHRRVRPGTGHHLFVQQEVPARALEDTGGAELLRHGGKLLDTRLDEANGDGRRVVLAHNRSALARAAGGGRPAFDQHYLAGAERDQMIGRAGTGDARADDDHVVCHAMPQI